MKRLTSLVLSGCALFVALGAAQPAYACRADWATNGRVGDIISSDFNEFAYIFDSAGDWYCYSSAAPKLKAKLQGYKDYYIANPNEKKDWKKWLAGGSVSFVMASGLFLGAYGSLDAELDGLIRDVARDYAFDTTFNGLPGGFTGTNWTHGNTYLEDYAMDASAQAWIAAYFRNTGRSGWSTHRQNSIAAMSNMLNPATTCIAKFSGTRDYYNGGPCNGTYADLVAVPPTGEIITLNHGQQSIAYGIGQMTSFGSAVVGLDVADRPFAKGELASDRINMATFLFAEGSAHATADPYDANAATFHSTGCRRVDVAGVSLPNDHPCYDTQIYSADHPSLIGQPTPYRADMFAIKPIYDRFQIPTGVTSGYMFDRWKDIFLTTGEDWYKMWGIGRKHFYGTLGSYFAGTPKPGMAGRGVYSGGIKRGSYWTSAPNSSTVTLGATSRTPTSNAQMTIVDNNSGSLRNGDPVSIKNVNGQYWSATNGNVTTTSTASTSTTFTIVKILDTTQMIAGGDQFALRTSSGTYLTASTLGTNVTATSATIGTYQKFTLDRTIDD